ncbi:MAG: bifunctional helix-turn-helix transcriptional regulator/GNAT family N-acetyltransferase [Chloroflexi bacterium]|nr:bifunctional helix-turn-helix transcriptional regulator/GNAT family N-acetyltransferase [Chloroflexota bacterium]
MPLAADAHDLGRVRAFNRTVAERIGALDDSFLARGRPMGESRVLWEIGPDGIEVRGLRARLSLDSGYLSRVLRSLEGQGLVVVEASADDGRVRSVQLTSSGRAEREELDRRSDAVASSFLEPLTPEQRFSLVAAMTRVERLLRLSEIRIAREDPTSPEARWCIEQYFLELQTRFETGFDPTRTNSAEAHELMPPVGALLVARLKGAPVGCGALKLHAREPAEIKRMWVAADARGLGLGRRLLAELERAAKEAGATAVRLETNRALTEAIHLYQSSGYLEVPAFNTEPYAHHWFEKKFCPATLQRGPRRILS